jgi:uncharacterized membrane protein YedE/YeeE
MRTNIALRPAYLLTAALCGLIFGAGLYISQMVDPLKILRFLDFTGIPSGDWDPSLAFVMAAGLAVMVAATWISKRQRRPVFDAMFHYPEFTRIDRPLVIGSALFGVGWGMSGICPGPAISLIAFWPPNLWIFLLAMFAGSLLGSAIVPTGESRRRVAPA